MSKAPIRGTQSFVGTMSEVWRRPLLTAMEVAARWLAWLPALWALSWLLGTRGVGVQANPQWFAAFLTEVQLWFQEVIHGSEKLTLDSSLLTSWVVLALAIAGLWGVLSGFGRGLLLRRIEPALIPRRFSVCVFAMLRVVLFASLLALWLAALTAGWIHFVQGPQARGEYPGYVPGFAILLVLTLCLFVFWACVSWIFRLAPILAMSRRLGPVTALRAAWATGPLRAKLIEINLVMGVVKVGLIVWSLALSTTPLPFTTHETEDFLHWWWFGTFVLWIVVSDYFHVVRQAAYVRLAQAYDFVPQNAAAEADSAS